MARMSELIAYVAPSRSSWRPAKSPAICIMDLYASDSNHSSAAIHICHLVEATQLQRVVSHKCNAMNSKPDSENEGDGSSFEMDLRNSSGRRPQSRRWQL